LHSKKLEQAFNIKLIIVNGEAKKNISYLIEKYKISSLIWNRLYSNQSVKRDSEIKSFFKNKNIQVETFNSHLLNEPWEVKNNSGQFFKVFTPYWKTAYKVYLSKKFTYQKKISIESFKHTENIEIKFLPNKSWNEKFSKYWNPGEDAALKKIDTYIYKDIDKYDINRNRPDFDQTSRISPHLRFGEISPRVIVEKIQNSKKSNNAVNTYLSEIGWREFSYSLLYYSEDLSTKPINPKFKKFPWRISKKDFSLWTDGKTGIPLVDAAMCQIYEEGWMHNRLRMVVGSFLVKNLLLNWTLGEQYFQNSLLDYDEASNAAGWQWIAGCGADASPYFRVFNPVLQSEKFDPQAKFILKYIPQLKILNSTKTVFEPYLDKKLLERLVKEKKYFNPIVDLKESRNRALDAYQQTKS